MNGIKVEQMQKRQKFEENEVIGRRSRHKSPAFGYI